MLYNGTLELFLPSEILYPLTSAQSLPLLITFLFSNSLNLTLDSIYKKDHVVLILLY